MNGLVYHQKHGHVRFLHGMRAAVVIALIQALTMTGGALILHIGVTAVLDMVARAIVDMGGDFTDTGARVSAGTLKIQ